MSGDERPQDASARSGPERSGRARAERARAERARAERARARREQEDLAARAIEAIGRGGDLAAETQALSNAFTDRQMARLGAWLRRVFRRPPRS